MPALSSWRLAVLLSATFLLALLVAVAQSTGNSGSIDGTVLAPTGAVVPSAKVEIQNPVSKFEPVTTTDNAGKFEFTNVPFNPHHLKVETPGFALYAQDVEPRSSVPVSVSVKLHITFLCEL